MGKLGWGTPTLDQPRARRHSRDPAAGVRHRRRAAARRCRPTTCAILNLQVNFAGVVDFERRELSFDASLFDSRVLTFTLTGDMAVRLYWGDNANFLLTVGGFHPAYTPPPMGLGPLQPAGDRDLRTAIPRLRAEAYFAVTSNTVQFGAKIELYAGASVFNVYGFLVARRADPVRSVPLHRRRSAPCWRCVSGSIDAVQRAARPDARRARRHGTRKGKASFEIGFIFTVTISVQLRRHLRRRRGSRRWPPIRVLRPADRGALNQRGNWSAVTPRRQPAAWSTRESRHAGAPRSSTRSARWRCRRRSCRSSLPITRFGARRIDGGNHVLDRSDEHRARRRSPIVPVRGAVRAGAVHRHERRREAVAPLVRAVRGRRRDRGRAPRRARTSCATSTSSTR